MKIIFTALLEKFASQGEKTGWTYITIPEKVAQKINPGVKRSFRVKGKLDDHPIKFVAAMPMGDGNFIIAINAAMRKAIRKQKGEKVEVELELDKAKIVLNKELLECLADEPAALQEFNKMAPSHQHYYSKWIDSAKTEATKAKRIALSVDTLAKKMNYGEMIRSIKN
ncbi:YdeI/OmpD-associated family protein [Ferruginibacter sp. HRS2-29]|uniref:DUF1905 domain-containing protein n=1 Tax=Ferruginibacter sp. HRS2-29 TaxID=2487334 RepID=UPI0020CF97AF|nr:YdeI/OmpD-associated family protein [Ferruginibacter sp. HRS2-29]MCP9751214.1 DUF1905 domain-containing protein [Ferruginibacter sp. HRS2-29]